jgi:hypothetical protein
MIHRSNISRYEHQGGVSAAQIGAAKPADFLGAINNNVVGSGRTPGRAGADVFVTSVK